MSSITKYILFTILCPLVWNTQCLGQNKVIDSLKNEIAKTSVDSMKVELLRTISGHFWGIDMALAESYAEDAFKLAETTKNPRSVMSSLYTLAATNYYIENDSLSESQARSALALAEELEEPAFIEACHNLISGLLTFRGDYHAAIELSMRGLKSAEARKDYVAMGAAYSNLANFYYQIGNFTDDIKYLKKAIESFDLGNDIHRASKARMLLLDKNTDAKTALGLIKDVLKRIEGHNFYELESSAAIRASFHYIELNDPDSSYIQLLKAEKIASQHDLGAGLLRRLDLAWSNYFIDRKQFGNALMKIKKYQDNSEGLLTVYRKSIFEYLFLIYEGLNDYQSSLTYYKLYNNLADSLSNNDQLNLIKNIEIKHETEKKEKKLAQQELELEKQKTQKNNILILGLMFALLAMGIFSYFYNKQKERHRLTSLALSQEKLESEKHEELSKLKSHFFTNLSHELRTPLTLIIGPLKRADHKINDPDAKKDVDLAHRNATKLHGLVNEILDLSKLEAGELSLNETTVPLDNFLRRCYYSFESLAEIRNIKLTLDNELSDQYNITIDQSKFEKVINNLVSNAIKFSNNDSEIKMEVKQLKDQMQISIKDQGRGIHPDDIDHVFERFFQTKQIGQELEGGTGIGLSYAREIVKKFGGKIKVESELNKGSRFSFTIPMSKLHLNDKEQSIKEVTTINELNTAEDKKEYRSISFDKTKSKLLIVEDNKEMQEYLLSILSDHYDCETANDGIEALDKTQHTQYDLITSDVMMPRMNGFSFKKAFNEKTENRDTAFIMLTARSLEEDKIRGLKLGVDDYLIKPFSPNELIARIDNLLQNKMDRALFSKESDTQDPEDVPLTGEQQILKQAEEYILENIDDQNMSVPNLAAGLGYSQRQITRVLKKSSGLTPVNFILEIRLQKARQIFESKKHLGVDQVRYEIGIDSASYFSRKYKERFGKSPSEELN